MKDRENKRKVVYPIGSEDTPDELHLISDLTIVGEATENEAKNHTMPCQERILTEHLLAKHNEAIGLGKIKRFPMIERLVKSSWGNGDVVGWRWEEHDGQHGEPAARREAWQG